MWTRREISSEPFQEMSEKIYRTKVPLYESSLRLVITDNVTKYYKDHVDDDHRWCVAFTAVIKGNLSIVAQPDASIGTLAHEAIHAAAEILSHHESRWGAHNQEPLCYLAGWIMDWIYRVVDGGP